MSVSLGNPILDEMVGGGLPARRPVLVIGGPGTGKSTLGMQFLQTGLENGDTCLLISTEQTEAELRDSFEPFAFDFDHDNLTITTLHPAAGETIDGGDTELTIKTLEGGEVLDTGFGIPFERPYLREVLEQYVPTDRVVLDSTSGLAAIGDAATFRRAILDLIRLFSDEFRATSLLTAESPPDDPNRFAGDEMLRFTTHGVIRLAHDDNRGTRYRYIQVEKLRGVDHDTRRYIVNITTDGLDVVPRRCSRPDVFLDRPVLPTGIDGLDTLIGGGIVEGAPTLYLHDGVADIYAVLTQVMAAAVRQGLTVGFTPPANLETERLDTFWEAEGFSVADLLDADQLLVEQFLRQPRDHHDNVFVYDEYDGVEEFFEAVHARTEGQEYLPVVDLEPILPRVPRDHIQRCVYTMEANLKSESHNPVYVLDPATVPDEFSSFLVGTAEQVLRHWQDDDGLEYVKLEKGSAGSPGTGRVVEYTADPPFVRLS